MDFFYTLFHKTDTLLPSPPAVVKLSLSAPPMDLSSLEGPPLPEPQEEEFLPPYPPELRALELSPPSPSTRHLIPSPLHPRRTETETTESPISPLQGPTSPLQEPVSPLQERRRQRNRPEGNPGEGNNLRRALAKRGRRSPDQLQLHITPAEEQEAEPQPQHHHPEPSPRHATHSLRPDRCRPKKPSHRLIWQEEEQLWIVAAPLPDVQPDRRVSHASSSPSPLASLFPSFSRSPVSPVQPPQHQENRSVSGNRVLGEMPPPYESHRFGPTTHPTSRWAAVTRRIPGLPVG